MVLMKATVSIFEGREITGQDLSYLSDTDLLILSAFISKKCKITFNMSMSRDEIANFINQHKTHFKHKRNEENFKLVMKKAVKSLSKRLKFTLNPEPKDKYELAYHFYKKYFEVPFREAGLDKAYGVVGDAYLPDEDAKSSKGSLKSKSASTVVA